MLFKFGNSLTDDVLVLNSRLVIFASIVGEQVATIPCAPASTIYHLIIDYDLIDEDGTNMQLEEVFPSKELAEQRLAEIIALENGHVH